MGVLTALVLTALAAGDEVVFITGASSGIGEACARELAKAGKRIVMTARRVDKLKAIADEINAAGGKAVYTALDVTDDAATGKAFEFAEKEFGGVDFVFANAGYASNIVTPLTEQDHWSDIGKVIDINVKGQIFTLRHAVKAFQKRGGGAIAFSSSVGSLGNYYDAVEKSKGEAVGLGAGMAYQTSKFALDGMVRLAGAYHNSNIRSYSLRIGLFESEMTGKFITNLNDILPEEHRLTNLDPFTPYNPLVETVGKPVVIAPVLLHLIDGTTEYPSGSSIIVQGLHQGGQQRPITADADPFTKVADMPNTPLPTREEMKKHLRNAAGGPYDWSIGEGGEL